MRFIDSFRRLALVCLVHWLCAASVSAALTSQAIGLVGDGVTDNTAALQKALGEGKVEIVLASGVYRLGTVDVPDRVTLRGEPGARIRIDPAGLRIYDTDTPASKNNVRCLFAIKGDHVTLRDFEFDFALVEAETTDRRQPGALITATGRAHLAFSGLVAERPEFAPPLPLEERRQAGTKLSHTRHPPRPPGKRAFPLAWLIDSRDIVMSDCRAAFMEVMIDLYHCSRVWVHRNRATDGYSITRSKGGDEFLHHTDNWNRNIVHQCRWWGGNANDTRKLTPESIGWGTAATVTRGSRNTDPDYNPYTVGAFDIIVANNQAEYGCTLAWGSKGRQVVFSGNIGRFMSDYVLGSEGGENVTFTGNIAINGYAAGLVAMYWSERLVMSGNVVVVRDEPFDPRYLWYSSDKGYQGSLIRLHTAPANTISGSGQTLITGNILSCELDTPRRISIEGDCDVMVSGNKIRNGVIHTNNDAGDNAGTVTITGNEFIMTAAHTSHWLRLAPKLSLAIVRDNVFRHTLPLSARSPTEMLLLAEGHSGADKARLRVIEGNQMIGFPLAIWARSHSRAQPDRFVIRNNNLDGVLRLEGVAERLSALVEGNVDLGTLEPVKIERLNHAPQPLPERMPAPEDKANEVSNRAAAD